MQIHRYIMPRIVSNMYIVSEGDAAIIIDPHENEEAMAFIKQSDFSAVDIFLTHEHFDHVSGVPYFTGVAHDVYASKESADIMAHPELRKENRFSQLFFQAVGSEELNRLHREKPAIFATKIIENDFSMEWQEHKIKFVRTPGHTPGCVCIIFDDDIIFTGDSLLPKKFTITRFPGGNRDDFENITKPYLESLPQNMLVYPGHGEITPLGECWV